MVLQTVDGAILYWSTGHDPRAAVSLPPGPSRRAVVTRDGSRTLTAYALVDDRLWWHDLSGSG